MKNSPLRLRNNILSTLTVMLLLASCSAVDTPEENRGEEDGETEKKEPPPALWVESAISHRTILRMVEEHDGDLTATGTEDEPFMSKTSSSYYETDLDLLVDIGMLAETEDGYEIASHAELSSLPDSEQASPSERSMAMDFVLWANEVDWCGEPERGQEFRESYLDHFGHENGEEPVFDTQDEYYASIADYVDCGDGHP